MNFVEDFDVSLAADRKVAGFVVSNFSGLFEFGTIRIPKKFNDRYGVSIPHDIVLVMGNGDSWSSIYDYKCRRIVGLEKFMEFYGVKTYWFMSVSFFGGMKFGVDIFSPKCVEILYPRLLPSFLNTNRNELVDGQAFNNRAIIEEKHGALLFFNMGFSSSSLFSFVVQASHLNEGIGKVVVSEGMCHVLKKFKNGENITLWLLKSKWEIAIEWHNFCCLFGRGWSLFAKDLELCSGDTCVFESTGSPLEFNVCVFRHEEYDFPIVNPDLEGVKFFQILFSHSLELCRIVLPISFGFYLGKCISSVVEFVMPNNQSWKICYEENPPRFSLLEEFFSFYGLGENYIIIFEYVGQSRFFVRVFDEKNLEILYLESSKVARSVAKLLKCKKPFEICNGEEGIVEEYVEMCDEIYESPNLSLLMNESRIVCEFTIAFHLSEFGQKIHDAYVCNSLEACFGYWINQSVSRLIAHGRQWRVEVKLERNTCKFGRGWNEFGRDNDLVTRDICILKVINFMGRVFKVEIIRV